MPLNANRLKQSRLRKGWNLDELESHSGVHKSQISRYERGDTEPMSSVLAAMAVALDVSTDYLLELSDNPDRFEDNTLTVDERAVLSAYRMRNVPDILELCADLLRKDSD